MTKGARWYFEFKIILIVVEVEVTEVHILTTCHIAANICVLILSAIDKVS